MGLTSHIYWAIVSGLFGGGFFFTLALTPAVMRLAQRMGAVDRGGYRKVYRGEIPLLGGLGIAAPLVTLGLLVALIGFLVVRNWHWVLAHQRPLFGPLFDLASSRHDALTLTFGGMGIVALGLVDDKRGLRAKTKLLGQVAVALFICISGHSLSTVTLPLVGSLHLGVVLGGLVTMLWVVGLINAVNLMDGIDGLATTISLVGAGALVALSIIQQDAFVTLTGAALAGSLVAFLLFNFPPARMFLGDTGSMFLGYSLAVTSLMGAQKSEAAVIVFAPLLALSLPVFETFVSMLRRYVSGVPIFSGDNRHTHHRLLKRGYSQQRVVMTLCGTAVLLSVAAVLTALIPEDSQWAWSPYALYAATLFCIAWMAGYLQLTSPRVIIERRNRNKVYQALGRYVSLRLSSGIRGNTVGLLMELCRQELGLRHIEVRLEAGRRLIAAPEDLSTELADGSTDSLTVHSADGGDVLVRYVFKHRPDPHRQHDVSLCLASIFDGIKLSPAALAAGKRASDSPEKACAEIVTALKGNIGRRAHP